MPTTATPPFASRPIAAIQAALREPGQIGHRALGARQQNRAWTAQRLGILHKPEPHARFLCAADRSRRNWRCAASGRSRYPARPASAALAWRSDSSATASSSGMPRSARNGTTPSTGASPRSSRMRTPSANRAGSPRNLLTIRPRTSAAILGGEQPKRPQHLGEDAALVDIADEQNRDCEHAGRPPC